jgi:2-hydroxychromene-2-carboxylate isomerase
VNRYVAEQVLRHVWEGGQDAVAPARLAALGELLSSHMQRRGRTMANPATDTVKQHLRANTDEALSAGAFGVPTCVVDGKLFWGLDGLPMLQAYLASDAWFDSPAWSSVATVPVGVSRSA